MNRKSTGKPVVVRGHPKQLIDEVVFCMTNMYLAKLLYNAKLEYESRSKGRPFDQIVNSVELVQKCVFERPCTKVPQSHPAAISQSDFATGLNGLERYMCSTNDA